MAQFTDKRVLPVAEWFAENAYISPGAHRLMTAAGLMAGLYCGRELMNVLTAQNARGEPVDIDTLAPPLQRIHGVMAYNKYEDTPETKWHKVADAFVPLFFGAVGAMAGSSHFAKGTPMFKNLSADLSKGSPYFQLQHADMLANKTQAKVLNFLSGFGLNMGSTSGVHLFPSMIASSTSAFRFQIDHGKNIILPGLRWLTNNRGHSSRNMMTSLSDFISWAQNNAAHYTNGDWHLKETDPILKYAKDMLQVFKEVTPEQRKTVADRLESLRSELGSIAQQTSETHGGIKGEPLLRELTRKESDFDKRIQEFLSGGLEQSFIDANGLLDPSDLKKSMENIALGDYGFISKAVRMLGGRSDIKEYGEQFEKAFMQRREPNPTNYRMGKLMPDDHAPILGGAAAVAGTLGLAHLLGTKKEKAANATESEGTSTSPYTAPQIDRTLSRHEQARQFHEQQSEKHAGGVKGIINGKPLDALSWMSSVLVVPPGLHRLMNAAFLSGFLYTGAKFSCALAGRDLKGAALPIENIWPIFKPFHGQMSYKWKSAETADRWKHVAHQLMPVGVGMFGTYAGSRAYFQDTIVKAHKAEYLEDYTDRISLEESESYAKASAVTSILNTGSGFHLLPLVSYPSNLQNRFLMAKGQQVASPGVGKWWSGNPSKYPWHIKKQLDAMIKYSLHNTSEFPVELDEMAYAVVAKLYPDLPLREAQEKRDAMVDKLYSIRDRYWQEGGIPQEKKAEALKALEGAFRREGLERTLKEIGLDPLEANLDNNGMSGKFARWSGAGHTVDRSIAEYKLKATTRLMKNPDAEREKPDSTIQTPAEEKIAFIPQEQQIH